jgi:hypothetical protein
LPPLSEPSHPHGKIRRRRVTRCLCISECSAAYVGKGHEAARRYPLAKRAAPRPSFIPLTKLNPASAARFVRSPTTLFAGTRKFAATGETSVESGTLKSRPSVTASSLVAAFELESARAFTRRNHFRLPRRATQRLRALSRKRLPACEPDRVNGVATLPGSPRATQGRASYTPLPLACAALSRRGAPERRSGGAPERRSAGAA